MDDLDRPTLTEQELYAFLFYDEDLPVHSRADARFMTGCRVSPRRTYSAPESRDITIAASPSRAGGRRHARREQAPLTPTDSTQPSRKDSDCARLGSRSKRMA